jgi:hypothetical protein
MRNFAVKYLFVFLTLSLATWLVWVRFDYPLTGIDDANIFFVYARNLASGHGFVYNIGGQRVEGFSSLLWTLICAVVFSFSDRPESILILINILVVSLGITAALSYIQSYFVSQRDSHLAKYFWPLLFLILLATSPTYMLWNTITLMENPIWNTLLLLGTILVISDAALSRNVNSVFIPLAALLLLTRPESLAWVSVFTGILLLRKALRRGIRRALWEMVPVVLSLVMIVASLTVFRLWYFGYPLPNTYYAKVSPSVFYNLSRGIPYIVKYFISNPIVSVSILAAILAGIHVILLLVERKFTDNGQIFLPGLVAVGLLAPVITGGDHFSSFRFYQGIYPILLLCLFYFMKTVLPRYVDVRLAPQALRMPQFVFVSGLVFLLTASIVSFQAQDWLSSEETSDMSDEFKFAQKGREQGEFLAEIFTFLPNFPSVGVVRAGGIKYTYPGEVVDLMGLNNSLMAHNGGRRLGEKNHAAFEKPTFYQLQPDLVSAELVSNSDWQYNAADLKNSWDNTVPLKDLYDDDTFLQLYTYARVESKEMPTEKALAAWFRKDFLHTLEARDDLVIQTYEYPAD